MASTPKEVTVRVRHPRIEWEGDALELDDRIRDGVLRAGIERGGLSLLAGELYSPFQALFGNAGVGRPVRSSHPTGVSTGDPQLTEAARRRAARVIRVIEREMFDRIMEMEVDYLRMQGGGASEQVVGAGGEGHVSQASS